MVEGEEDEETVGGGEGGAVAVFIHFPGELQARLQICEIRCHLLLIWVIYNTHSRSICKPPFISVSRSP